MKTNKKSFPATLTHLPKILTWVRAQLDNTVLAPASKTQIEIALEEAIVNIISHARSSRDLSLSCALEPHRQIEFIVTDHGEPFNPLIHKTEADPEISLHDREEGGLGLLLMKQYMDDLFYRREDEKNILTLIKNL